MKIFKTVKKNNQHKYKKKEWNKQNIKKHRHIGKALAKSIVNKQQPRILKCKLNYSS